MFLFYIQITYTLPNLQTWNIFVKITKSQSSWYWKIILILIRKVKSVPFIPFPAVNGTMILHMYVLNIYIYIKSGKNNL